MSSPYKDRSTFRNSPRLALSYLQEIAQDYLALFEVEKRLVKTFRTVNGTFKTALALDHDVYHRQLVTEMVSFFKDFAKTANFDENSGWENAQKTAKNNLAVLDFFGWFFSDISLRYQTGEYVFDDHWTDVTLSLYARKLINSVTRQSDIRCLRFEFMSGDHLDLFLEPPESEV